MLPTPVTLPRLFLVSAAFLAAAAGCQAGAAPEAPNPAPPPGLCGKPEVMQFTDGKLGAVSLRFDDSMPSQADVAIPHLNTRGLVGTFFVNPARDRYKARREVWEIVCPRSGHQLANHTMHHLGAKTYEEAAYEIGECSRHIWSLYPQRSKLLPFSRGGGTTWEITDEQMRELAAKHFLFRHRSTHSVCNDPNSEYYNPDDTDIRAHAQRAIDERTWVEIMFHGIGSEWISCSEETFVDLLDFLVEKSYETIEVEGQRVAQFDVRPGVGEATVTRVSDPL